MRNKTYTAFGFIWELATTIDHGANRKEVWAETFNGLEFHEVEEKFLALVESSGQPVWETYRARPVGNANRGAKVNKTRGTRFPVAKLLGFAELAGFNLPNSITNA